MAVGGQQGWFEHAVKAGQGNQRVGGHDRLIINLAHAGPGGFPVAETTHFSAAFPEEAGVASGFPEMLAE